MRKGACLNRRWALATGLAGLAAMLCGVGLRAVPAEEPPLLEYSYNGSERSGREFMRVMQPRAVQRLLLDVAAEPRPRAFVDAALAGTGVTAGQLQASRLVRLNGERYELAFSLITRDDRQKIQAMAEREGARLARDILAHRAEIEATVKKGNMPTSDWRATAFFILGCASLDWDGLNLVRKRGYLAEPSGDVYLPEAVEPVSREAVRRLYWGSHSYHESAAVTTFGDHAAIPRAGLPDIFRGFSLDAPEPAKARWGRAAEGLVRRHAAALMLQLRDGPKSIGQLKSATGFDEPDVKNVMSLLEALQYVSVSGDTYTATITVLTERDRPMVTELRRLGLRVMETWLDERYGPISADLATITPRRYGVPLSQSFWWVWHYLFGTANRELVAAGLFADPYDPKRTFQGFIPAVYRLNVVQGRF